MLCFYIFKLWYNTCNIKFTVLTICKCAVQCGREMHSHGCAAHLQKSFHLAKLKLDEYEALLTVSPAPAPGIPIPLSVSASFTTPGVSHSWNHAVFGFVTGLFCQHYVLELILIVECVRILLLLKAELFSIV